MAWNAALASQYGYGRVFREYPQEVLEQQPTRRQLAVFQPPSVTFPKLGQWQPHAMDLPEAFAVLIQQPPRRLLAIFQPSAIPYPRAWRVYLDNWAAVGRKDDVIYIARNWLMPASQPPPIKFPFLGGWQVGIMNPPDPSAIWAAQRTWIQYKPLITLLSQIGLTAWTIEVDNQAAIIRPPFDYITYVSQERPPVLPPLPLTGQPAWAWQLDNQAAVSRLDQIIYLTQIGLKAPSGPTIYSPQPWEVEQDNFASIGRLDSVLYYARNSASPIGDAPVGAPSWKSELASWAALNYKQQIIYLVQIGFKPVIVPYVAPTPWAVAQSNWAAIGRLDQVIYIAKNKTLPIGGYEFLNPAWRGEVANWASLIGGIPIAVQLVRAHPALVEAAKFIPAWRFELFNLAAINYKQQIIYLIRTGLVVLSPFIPPIAASSAKSPNLNWRHYYPEWPQVELGYRLPNVGILAPEPQPPPVPGEISCYTIEAPPTATAFLLAESPYVNVFMTETGLIVALTGESPHICIG